MTTTENVDTFAVRCADGTYRHSQLFGTFDEARQFAHWGHACTATHVIVWHHADGTVTQHAENHDR